MHNNVKDTQRATKNKETNMKKHNNLKAQQPQRELERNKQLQIHI